MKYGDLTLGQVEALVNVLGGMDAVKALLVGEKKFVFTDTSSRVSKPVGAISWHSEMSRFYKEVFNEDVDFASVAIPADPGGYSWALPVVKGMTLNRAWATAKPLFPCWLSTGDDLDKAVPTNERTPMRDTYIIRVRTCVEADEELKNFSAVEITELKLATMTLLERIILELWYCWKCKKHLDIQNVTLCAGSRDSNGNVPSACWVDGGFWVDWDYPGHYLGSLRARAVVS